MSGPTRRVNLIPAACLAILGLAVSALNAQTNTAPPPGSAAARDADERAACVQNLKAIYQAVQSYQADHKALPNWLSDLVPHYLPDANVLICPVSLRTGETESRTRSDPKLPCSYVYEFSSALLGKMSTNAPSRTHREWKQRQMGLVGSIVPIVRCRHHKPLLNVAFDGTIYDSGSSWESSLTNRINPEQLTPDGIFAADAALIAKAVKASKKGSRAKRYGTRDAAATKQMLDLTRFYNAGLGDAWAGGPGNDLSALPNGLPTLGGVQYDIRGIVQLASKSLASTNFPSQVQGIKVRQPCERIHFLHAAGFGKPDPQNPVVGWYVLRYAGDQMELKIPIRYGRDVEDWHGPKDAAGSTNGVTIAWQGENAASKRAGDAIRVFSTTWTNVAPAVAIESIDFISAKSGPAPFLLAITVDGK
jgi:hypothetical protein